MGETVLLVALIVVLFLTTAISVFAMLRMRGKMNSASEESLDASFDICISELNKMGSLIKSEIDAKYKEILFLYELIEDRHKQIEGLVAKNELRENFEEVTEGGKEVAPFYEEVYGFEFGEPDDEPEASPQSESQSDYSRSYIPDHKIILEMSESGMRIADIAKELGIGQGEVKLILNIARK